MPFSKRIVEPPLLCRHPIPNDEGLLFEDLSSINNVVLSRTLRQLSDLAKHACSLFEELENEIISTNQRVWVLQNKIGKIQQTASGLDPKQEPVPVSNLDVESKLTAHYQAPWHQQHNVFHPSTRPPCLDDLHRHAKQNLRALHRDQQQRQRSSSRERHQVTISISVAPPMPSYPSPRTLRHREQRGRHARTQERAGREVEYQHAPRQFSRKRPSSLTDCCFFIFWRKTAPATDKECEVGTLGHRPKGPVPNVPSTLDKQTNWSKALPLPTPEDRLKSDPHAVSSCIIPINVSGVGFDREASARCSLVHSQSVLQRRRKLRRRKTITGIPRRVQQDMDSDESPVARERTVIIHGNQQLSLCSDELSLSSRMNTKDSGCQTEDFTITAPSRRRIRAQRGGQGGIPASLSHSTGNISSLPDCSEAVYTSSSGRLRSRSLPREGGRIRDEVEDDDSDEDDEEDDEDEDEELSPYEAEDFLPVPGQHIMKDEEESTDDQAMPELQLGSLKRGVPRGAGSPDHGWIERGRSRLPRKADMGSCEISSSSDTFSSPIHSVSTTGVLGGQIDHKEDHQSSSGNWSGSSSTCPSQTSETLPPASSPPLTGSSHCDSELSLNTAPHIIDDTTGFIIDPFQSDRAQTQGQRSSSFTSSATDQMDDAGVSTASEGEWNYTQDQPEQDQPCSQDFSPKRSREEHSGPGYRATYEGFSGKTCGEAGGTNLHYSDSEGLYATMHFACGLKESRSYVYNYAADNGGTGATGMVPSHGGDGYTQSDYRGNTRSLGRQCLSLRKPKAKPPPPKRSSSLKEASGMDAMMDQSEPKTLICDPDPPLPLSSREMKLDLDLAASVADSEMLGLEPETRGAWGVESSREVDDASPFCSSDTHSFKDEGAVQSDYADLWLLSDLRAASAPYRSVSTTSTATCTTVIECVKSPEAAEPQALRPSTSRSTSTSTSHPPPTESEFKLSSPEKLAGLASPSSGYSSQSETPTSSFPSAFFPNPLSPTTGKRKPKVPERKSSLSSLQQQQQQQQNQHLSLRDNSCSTTRPDPDFPAPPPAHQLDLSALHSGPPKPPPYRMHTLHHHNKQRAAAMAAAAEARAAAAAAAAAAASGAASASTNTTADMACSGQSHMAITPTVLKSVQLRTVSTREEEQQCSMGTLRRPKQTGKPPAYKAHDAPPQELASDTTRVSSGDSTLPAEAQAQAQAQAQPQPQRPRQQRLVPGTYWAMTAFRTPVEVTGDDDDLIPQSGATYEPQRDPPDYRAPGSSGDPSGSLQISDHQTLKHHAADTGASLLSLTSTLYPPAQSELTTTASCGFVLFNSPDKVPARPLEASHAYEISDARSREDDCEFLGVHARSASQDNRDESSTPDTEDYFSKDSTPSDNSISPLTDDSKAEEDVFPSPNRLRTTEDLFAMIHRSKRKVLGRKDSGEMSVKSRVVPPSAAAAAAAAVVAAAATAPLTMPVSVPVTTTQPSSMPAAAQQPPTTPASGLQQRVPGPIYRNAKKSSTSNEEFKLLLLKKGSRTDSSYRMSATEILKSPITPKSPGELLLEGVRPPTDEPPSPQQDSPSAGPEQQQQSSPQYPRANTEGFSPKTLSMTAASRQGRSRVPPAANSSRYSTRSRLYMAPMQAISEGETENSDGSPHDDRSS
ncbi:actin remodeling regulator NHS [Engraulis encrasicolus]|uniref:actin remodeling regulator NHS n=1 Tax=Engraulis encrasicolus TaxID=184585 RepID=UPI002FD101EF